MQIVEGIVTIILLVIGAIILFALFRASFRLVSQEERLVIYRLGRFARIGGPGLTLVIPWLEKIKKVIEVRDRPVEVRVPGILAYGVYNDLTLNIWYRVDLKQVAGQDKQKLARLVEISEAERAQQVQVKMREALTNQVALLEQRSPLPKEVTTFDRLMALTPGKAPANALRQGIMQELEQTLPSIGVILNTEQPLVVTGRGVPQKIIDSINRMQGRDIDGLWLTKYVTQMRRDFPEVPGAVLAQLLSSVDGIDIGQVEQILMDNETKTTSELELEKNHEGRRESRMVMKPDKPDRPGPANHDKSPQTPRPLTKRDLTVLKRLPRRNQDKQVGT